VQSKLGTSGVPENNRGELHYVGAGVDGALQHWALRGGTWQRLAIFGGGVTSGPCLIEGTYGAGNDVGIGNFELCVAVGGAVEHWWRHNATTGLWTRSATFGSDARRVIALLESSFGTNLEIVVERTDGRSSTTLETALAGTRAPSSSETRDPISSARSTSWPKSGPGSTRSKSPGCRRSREC
jgi:hypothetical protein